MERVQRRALRKGWCEGRVTVGVVCCSITCGVIVTEIALFTINRMAFWIFFFFSISLAIFLNARYFLTNTIVNKLSPVQCTFTIIVLIVSQHIEKEPSLLQKLIM